MCGGLFSSTQGTNTSQQSNSQAASVNASNFYADPRLQNFLTQYSNQYSQVPNFNVPASQFLQGAAARQTGVPSQYTPIYNQAGNIAQNGITPESINSYLSPYTQDVVNKTQQQFNYQNSLAGSNLNAQLANAGALTGSQGIDAQSKLATQEQLAQAPVIAGLYNQGFQTAGQLAQANTQAQLAGLGQASGAVAGETGANTALGNLGANVWGENYANALAPYTLSNQGAQGLWQLGLLGGTSALQQATGSGVGTGQTVNTPSPISSGLGLLGLFGSLFGASGGAVPEAAADGGEIEGKDFGGGVGMPRMPRPGGMGGMGGFPKPFMAGNNMLSKIGAGFHSMKGHINSGRGPDMRGGVQIPPHMANMPGLRQGYDIGGWTDGLGSTPTFTDAPAPVYDPTQDTAESAGAGQDPLNPNSGGFGFPNKTQIANAQKAWEEQQKKDQQNQVKGNPAEASINALIAQQKHLQEQAARAAVSANMFAQSGALAAEGGRIGRAYGGPQTPGGVIHPSLFVTGPNGQDQPLPVKTAMLAGRPDAVANAGAPKQLAQQQQQERFGRGGMPRAGFQDGSDVPPDSAAWDPGSFTDTGPVSPPDINAFSDAWHGPNGSPSTRPILDTILPYYQYNEPVAKQALANEILRSGGKKADTYSPAIENYEGRDLDALKAGVPRSTAPIDKNNSSPNREETSPSQNDVDATKPPPPPPSTRTARPPATQPDAGKEPSQNPPPRSQPQPSSWFDRLQGPQLNKWSAFLGAAPWGQGIAQNLVQQRQLELRAGELLGELDGKRTLAAQQQQATLTGNVPPEIQSYVGQTSPTPGALHTAAQTNLANAQALAANPLAQAAQRQLQMEAMDAADKGIPFDLAGRAKEIYGALGIPLSWPSANSQVTVPGGTATRGLNPPAPGAAPQNTPPPRAVQQGQNGEYTPVAQQPGQTPMPNPAEQPPAVRPAQAGQAQALPQSAVKQAIDVTADAVEQAVLAARGDPVIAAQNWEQLKYHPVAGPILKRYLDANPQLQGQENWLPAATQFLDEARTLDNASQPRQPQRSIPPSQRIQPGDLIGARARAPYADPQTIYAPPYQSDYDRRLRNQHILMPGATYLENTPGHHALVKAAELEAARANDTRVRQEQGGNMVRQIDELRQKLIDAGPTVVGLATGEFMGGEWAQRAKAVYGAIGILPGSKLAIAAHDLGKEIEHTIDSTAVAQSTEAGAGVKATDAARAQLKSQVGTPFQASKPEAVFKILRDAIAATQGNHQLPPEPPHADYTPREWKAQFPQRYGAPEQAPPGASPRAFVSQNGIWYDRDSVGNYIKIGKAHQGTSQSYVTPPTGTAGEATPGASGPPMTKQEVQSEFMKLPDGPIPTGLKGDLAKVGGMIKIGDKAVPAEGPLGSITNPHPDTSASWGAALFKPMPREGEYEYRHGQLHQFGKANPTDWTSSYRPAQHHLAVGPDGKIMAVPNAGPASLPAGKP